ncbi:hypothetical protein CGRA01v4_01069 [Colletotrichum graminicola]|nr:hypothetical protein CGRA01v4_01069 [Colletotrichum graminicola]
MLRAHPQMGTRDLHGPRQQAWLLGDREGFPTGPVCRQLPRNGAPSSRFDPTYPRFLLRFLPTAAPMPYMSYSLPSRGTGPRAWRSGTRLT